jgi:hypothetical protein
MLKAIDISRQIEGLNIKVDVNRFPLWNFLK